ncbi:MAG: tRNA epoxyqueuosine(34) reductase QueG, partial [Bacilli bacterium]
EPDVRKRTEPRLLLPTATSIIAIGLQYPSKLKNPPVSKRGAYRGIFCRASWGDDYHHIVGEKLALIASFLKERVPEAELLSMVDTGALVDRAVASRAGIGWSGKNCAVLNEESGTYMYLGELLTNIPFLTSEPVTERCGTCTKCIDACPTGALVGPGQLNSAACIAFLTQTKSMIPEQYRKKIGNRLYGCDTCQVVCPYNRGKDTAASLRMIADPERVKPLLIPLLDMSNRTFKEVYGHMSGAWRGKNPIQRNAIIALGNFKDESAVPKLIELLCKDPRAVIRGTCAWALGEIQTSDAHNALVQVQHTETDPDVRIEIDNALRKF